MDQWETWVGESGGCETVLRGNLGYSYVSAFRMFNCWLLWADPDSCVVVLFCRSSSIHAPIDFSQLQVCKIRFGGISAAHRNHTARDLKVPNSSDCVSTKLL